MPTTIYDVARRAAVSTATVSKVLSGTPYVSDKTREKVLAAVTELNYVPSLAARSLNTARTYILGLAFPYTPDYLFNDPHLVGFMRGVEYVAAEHDYSILLMPAREGDDAASGLRRLLRTQYVDGAIVVGMQTVQPITEELRFRTYPTVALGYTSPTGAENTVHADDWTGGYLAARHLLDLGHRRIGVLSGPEEISAVTERLAGCRQALEEAGLGWQPELCASGDFTTESGYAAAATLLHHTPALTAIFAINDRMALGVMAYAAGHGLGIPSDFSVVGFDDIPAAAYALPPLTTIRQPSLEMGRRAAQRLFDLLESQQASSEPIVLPVELVLRQSTATPRR